MEHKLSAKAIKIRHRLTFTKTNSARGLESPLVLPIEANPPSSRPRSATNTGSPTQEESTQEEQTWKISEPDPSRGYSFTDDPGYFRPASPFIDRQEIEEDLEDDIKHACAMLSYSIDRGLSTGLSHQSVMPFWTDGQNPAGQPSVNTAALSLEQHVLLLSAPKPIKSETESTKKHDSGVGMSFNSPSQPMRPYDNSASRTDTSARFYNKQPSASPPHSPSASEHRSRSQSLTTTAEHNQWERTYSSSLVPFPYSPPQLNSEWKLEPMTPDSPVSSLNEIDRKLEATDTNDKPETFSPTISPQGVRFSGVDRTWRRASRDPQRLNEEQTTTMQAKEPKPMIRFYSSHNQPAGTFNSREWLEKNFWDRDPSVYSDVSLASPLDAETGTVSRPETGNPRLGNPSTNEQESRDGYPSSRAMSYSASCLVDESKHRERVYSVDVPGLPPKNNRRKKASLLLRKLAGLGIKKKENNNENEVC
ncbi:uncharacterized protein N7479_005516 [Penicillium vulpinum]|uniref:Uncharacterized protein n=1 Tax=Penicillium vulpinum TaxID=29845 RepID=A0A1V6SDH2_9EURO|nr:uncharacterized protein N7479_005516 [Penicillium vulpinum]KAJ5958366.1 hypothetical protein N7479_005516 [Penicillium vulpinum]OQE12075.1 hypothetical protein PENVUL_c001G09916 [Penicillium vulpinum]